MNSPTAKLCRTLRVARESRLSDSHLHALAYIVEQGGLAKLSDIAKEIGTSPAAVTGNIDQLERMGLVSRRHSRSDRRTITCDPTPKGRQILVDCLTPDVATPALAVPTLGLRHVR